MLFYLLICSLDLLSILSQVHMPCLQWAVQEGQQCAWKSLTLCFLISVLVNNVEDLIQQQTSNDTLSPRASSSYYEQYHSLNEVSHFADPQRYCVLLTRIATSTITSRGVLI